MLRAESWKWAQKGMSLGTEPHPVDLWLPEQGGLCLAWPTFGKQFVVESVGHNTKEFHFPALVLWVGIKEEDHTITRFRCLDPRPSTSASSIDSLMLEGIHGRGWLSQTEPNYGEIMKSEVLRKESKGTR
jgi:hypothetical protein